MASRFPLPPEGRLEALLADAYERLPGPEAARLTQIGERLIRSRPARRRPVAANRLPWWIVILAVSGAAAATWYAGEIARHVERPAAAARVEGGRLAAPPRPAGAPEDGRTRVAPRGLIYRRETP